MKHSQQIISTDLLLDSTDETSDAGPDTELREGLIADVFHGTRVDRALAAIAPEFSRNHLQQIIESGDVRINGIPVVRPAAKVRAGDKVSLELRPTPQSQAFRPEVMALDVVHEDAHLLVLNKPAGLVVHPAPGHWSGTLLNGLLARDPHAANLPRAGIVHRLDKDTTGLMMVARSRIAMDALVRMIAAREVKRQYLALAHRSWQGALHRLVDAAIGRDPRNRLRMAVVDGVRHAGKPAVTEIELLDNGAEGCLVFCTLQTGRTHQIRVHLASIGHPLVADTLYGGANAAAMTRQALHAVRLAFLHPIDRQPMKFEAPLPEDLEEGLKSWGLRYNKI